MWPAQVAGPLASGRGLPKMSPHGTCGRKEVCGDLLPLFYLGAHTTAYRKAAPTP